MRIRATVIGAGVICDCDVIDLLKIRAYTDGASAPPAGGCVLIEVMPGHGEGVLRLAGQPYDAWPGGALVIPVPRGRDDA